MPEKYILFSLFRMDAKAAAAARRAKILARGTDRLTMAKGEAVVTTQSTEAKAAHEETASSPTSERAESAEGVVADPTSPAPSTPGATEQESASLPFRPLAARRNLVKSVASTTTTPVATPDSSSVHKETSAAEVTPSFSSPARASAHEVRTDSSESKGVSTDSVSSSSSATTPPQQAQEAASEEMSRPAPIISPLARKVEEEIAEIKMKEVLGVDSQDNLESNKKAARPLADRKNKIKGGVAAAAAGASAPTPTSTMENDAVVKAALAKAGLVPIQHAAVMKFVRLVGIFAAAVFVAYQSSVSSGPVIRSSPMFADAPALPSMSDVSSVFSAISGRGAATESSEQPSTAETDDSMDRLSAALGQQTPKSALPLSTFSFFFSPNALVTSAIMAASNVGVKINSSILESSIFAVTSIWFVSGVFSQFISSRFASRDKEKQQTNIASSIFAFLTTGVEGKGPSGLWVHSSFLTNLAVINPSH